MLNISPIWSRYTYFVVKASFWVQKNAKIISPPPYLRSIWSRTGAPSISTDLTVSEYPPASIAAWMVAVKFPAVV